MNRFSITENGRTSYGVTEAEATDLGYSDAAIASAKAGAEGLSQRGTLRRAIAANPAAGDTESLLGTTADGAGLVLIELAKLAKAIAEAGTVAQITAAAQPLADLTADILNAVEAGDVRFPYQLKGEDIVLAEIGERVTAVADIMAAAGGEA